MNLESLKKNKRLKIQMLEWVYGDFDTIVNGFGVTETGASICLSISGFQPWFYVKVVPNLDIHESILQTRIKSHVKVEFVEKQDFYGFQGERIQNFYKLSFKNIKELKNCSYKLQKTYQIYESKVDHILRFFHMTDIKPSEMISIPSCQLKYATETTTQLQSFIHYNDMEKCDTLQFPIYQISLDIEVYSSNTNFPKASEPLNVITHIGLATKWTTETNFSEYICLTLGECDIVEKDFKLEMDPIDSNIPITHLIYKTERELLIGLNETFQKYDPDIVLTFNGDLFDYEYIYERMLFNDVDSQMTRFIGKKDNYIEIAFDSKAHGKTDFTRVEIPGRIQHDILITIKKEFKLRNYKLNTIAKEFLGQEKIDMSYNDMFKAYREKDGALNKKVAIYCIQDVRLNQLLYDHCKFLQGNMQLSNIVWVPYSFLVTRGEQIKVMSLILKETLDLGFIIPNIISYNLEYEGATVLNPKRCGVYSGPIITLDFASLYPSIMMAQNLCYMTIVLDKKYLNLPGYEYKHLEWDYHYINKDTKEKHVNHISLDYVTNIIGLSPKILKRVGESRKATKKEMKTLKNKNSFEYVVLDKRQLGYKLVMNSYYGFMAAQKLSCPEISATVTYYGRKMIEQVQNWVDTNVKGAESIYGGNFILI